MESKSVITPLGFSRTSPQMAPMRGRFNRRRAKMFLTECSWQLNGGAWILSEISTTEASSRFSDSSRVTIHQRVRFGPFGRSRILQRWEISITPQIFNQIFLFSQVYPEKYCKLVEEEKGIKLLMDLMDHMETCEKLKELAQMVLSQCDRNNAKNFMEE